jgi:hypothetical protein
MIKLLLIFPFFSPVIVLSFWLLGGIPVSNHFDKPISEIQPDETDKLILREDSFDDAAADRLGTPKFFDDFENGSGVWNNGGEFNTSYYGHGSSIITDGPMPHSGSKVLRMRTTNGGGGSSSDWHAQTNNNRYNIGTPTNNSDFLIRFYLRLEKKVGFNIPNGDWGFLNLAQYKGVGPNRNSPLHAININVRGNSNLGGNNYLSMSYFGAQWGTPPNSTFTPLVQKDLPYKQWVEIIIRTKVSDGNGIFQVWQDGVMIFDLRNQRTWRNDGGMTRLDATVNNYGRYTRAMNLDGTWDGLSYMDIFIDDYGVYELNPNWDYDLDQPKNQTDYPNTFKINSNALPTEGGKVKIIKND